MGALPCSGAVRLGGDIPWWRRTDVAAPRSGPGPSLPGGHVPACFSAIRVGISRIYWGRGGGVSTGTEGTARFPKMHFVLEKTSKTFSR